MTFLQANQPEALGQVEDLVLAHVSMVVPSVDVLERGDAWPFGVFPPHDPFDVRVQALAHGRTILRRVDPDMTDDQLQAWAEHVVDTLFADATQAQMTDEPTGDAMVDPADLLEQYGGPHE